MCFVGGAGDGFCLLVGLSVCVLFCVCVLAFLVVWLVDFERQHIHSACITFYFLIFS